MEITYTLEQIEIILSYCEEETVIINTLDRVLKFFIDNPKLEFYDAQFFLEEATHV